MSVKCRVALLPRDLDERTIRDECVVVFDVLRATTTMAAALVAGVRSIRIFDSLLAVRAFPVTPDMLRCGEEKCLKPADFDLGNSPGQFKPSIHAGKQLCMCTTNGTHAIIAAQWAADLFAGAIVNATSVAKAVAKTGRNVTLLCAGTNGQVAMEDVIGVGAVLNALEAITDVEREGDEAVMAGTLFAFGEAMLPELLLDTQGGRNIHRAGLSADIAYAARRDVLKVVPRIVIEGGAIHVRAGD